MASYLLTQEAAFALQDIWDYIAPDNESAADRVVADLVSGFEHLAKWPKTGRLRPEITSKQIFFWSVRKYLVAYSVNEKRVTILAIFHGARDLPTIVSERL